MVELNQYFMIGRAIVELFQPLLVEVVIHDIKTNKIVFTNGSISKREVGDSSLLEFEPMDMETKVYSKVNFDGRLLKSVSIPIKNKGKMIAMMCINYDVSLFKELNSIVNILIDKKIPNEVGPLFKNDWQNKINEFIAMELQKNGKQFAILTNKDKKAIVHNLFQLGAFSEKNAADYIAKVMNVGRATIFNYLRNFKNNGKEL